MLLAAAIIGRRLGLGQPSTPPAADGATRAAAQRRELVNKSFRCSLGKRDYPD
jgi:hypothetical protein